MKNTPILILLAFALISTTGCKKAVCVPDYSTTESSKHLTVSKKGNFLHVFNNSTSKILIRYWEVYYHNGSKPYIYKESLTSRGNISDFTVGVWLSWKYELLFDSPKYGAPYAIILHFERANCESYSNGIDTEQAYYSF